MKVQQEIGRHLFLQKNQNFLIVDGDGVVTEAVFSLPSIFFYMVLFCSSYFKDHNKKFDIFDL